MDDFAVGPQQEPEHAVGAGVLRPHVDEHLVCPDVKLDHTLVVDFGKAHGFLRCASEEGSSIRFQVSKRAGSNL
jgi:hypothetical protein